MIVFGDCFALVSILIKNMQQNIIASCLISRSSRGCRLRGWVFSGKDVDLAILPFDELRNPIYDSE